MLPTYPYDTIVKSHVYLIRTCGMERMIIIGHIEETYTRKTGVQSLRGDRCNKFKLCS